MEHMDPQNGIVIFAIIMMIHDNMIHDSMTSHFSVRQEDLPTYWVDMCSGDHAKGMTLEDGLGEESPRNHSFEPDFCRIRIFCPRGREPHQESGAQHWLQWLPHLAGHTEGEDVWQRLWWGSCLRFSELIFLRFRSVQLPNTTNQVQHHIFCTTVT